MHGYNVFVIYALNFALILTGHDINLGEILLCYSESADERFVNCGNFSVVLKDSDRRLSKSLTLGDYNVAFGVLKAPFAKCIRIAESSMTHA